MSVGTPSSPATRPRRRGVVSGYDFRAPARLSRDQTRLIEVAFETFARQWTTQLGSRLRCQTQVTLGSLTEQSYDAYAAHLPVPSVLIPFTQDGYGTGVLQLTTPSALAHLDHALGGPGGEQPVRQLTEIEQSITSAMCERALGALGYAFAAVAPLNPAVGALQHDPQLLQAARATDMVVVAEFSVQIGAQVEPATLMLPLSPLMSRLSTGTRDEARTLEERRRGEEAARAMGVLLPHVPVDVSVSMQPVAVPPERVLSLRVGDVVPLHHSRHRPLEVTAAGIRIATAVPTARGSRLASLIVSNQEDPR